MSQEKDNLTFWKLFHSLLRLNSKAEEAQRSREALLWTTDNIVKIRAVCSGFELELVKIIWDFWREHKQAPSLSTISDQIEKLDKTEELVEALEEYEALKSSLKVYEVYELEQVLSDKTLQSELVRLNFVLKVSHKIANSSLKDGFIVKKDQPKLQGPKDALNYFLSEAQKGILVSDAKSLGGDLKVLAKDMEVDYQDYKKMNEGGSLVIKTGLHELDKVIGGFKRGTFWGLLGFAGTFKSTTGRSMVYEAVHQGFNVMHIPLEQSYEEERNIYGIMHSHHPKFGTAFNLSKQTYEDGNLTPEEENFLFNEVIPDLENLPASLIIRQLSDTSWEAIKAEVELQNQIIPIDLVFIDYLSLVDTSSVRAGDVKGTINNTIKNAKTWSYTFNQGVGIALLTPVQGNRQGLVEAAENDGQWTMNGVYDFSEFDKSLDGCIYTFSDPNLQAQNRIKLGTAKVRRSRHVGPFEAFISPISRLVQNLVVSGPVLEHTLDDDDFIDAQI